MLSATEWAASANNACDPVTTPPATFATATSRLAARATSTDRGFAGPRRRTPVTIDRSSGVDDQRPRWRRR